MDRQPCQTLSTRPTLTTTERCRLARKNIQHCQLPNPAAKFGRVGEVVKIGTPSVVVKFGSVDRVGEVGRVDRVDEVGIVDEVDRIDEVDTPSVVVKSWES